MRTLRESGIYVLPDGGEVIACAAQHGYYFLRSLISGSRTPPAYVVNSTGQLVNSQRFTSWLIEDLIDTGRMSQQQVSTASDKQV